MATTMTARLYGLPWSPLKARSRNGLVRQAGQPIEWRICAQLAFGKASFAQFSRGAFNEFFWMTSVIFPPTAWEQPLRT